MKSQSELNWVFILVAGAIILAFFTGFAFKYKDLQEEKTSIELVTTLDNALTSLKSSPFNTYDEITLPFNVEITCNNIIINEESFETNNLLFSKAQLEDKMLIYYKQFNIPFKVADFYFITDLKQKYHIIYDSSTQAYITKLINDLPEELAEKFSSSNLQKSQANVKNIEIKNLNNNKIKVNSQELYLNQDLIYAAIFSDNFNCAYDKIKEETSNTVSVYEDKIITLNYPGCSYSQFLSYLDKIKEFDLSYINSIDSLNYDLAAQNCPTLY